MFLGFIIYWIISTILIFFLCRFYFKDKGERWTRKDYASFVILSPTVGPFIVMVLVFMAICFSLTLMIEKILGIEE